MGSTSLPPVEVVSVDRSAMDPSSMSRSNVLYLNDYSLWTNAARAFCREDPASDRSEVEKRQERRDKRRERRGHERTVKAEEIEGYMGMKEVKDLLEYIGGEVEKNKEGMSGRKEMGKASKRGKEVESSATPRPGDTSKSAETPQVKVTSKQKSRTTQKATSSKSPEMGERGKSGLGRDTVSTEGSLSGENAEEGGIPDDKEFSASAKTIEQTELDPSRDISMDLGGTSTRSKSPAPIESIQQSIESLSTAVSDGPTRKPAPRTNEPEQTLGSKKSKKQNSKKNRCAAQGADKTWQDSRGAIGETTSASLGSSPTHNVASNEIRRTSESGNALPADGATSTFSEELMADTTNEDVSQSYRHPYKSVQDRIQDKDRTQDKDRIQDKDDDWTVHMRRHPKQRAKPGDGDNRTSEQNPTVWKDPLGRPLPGYRRPDAPRGSSGRVGSVGDAFQGPKYPLGRGRQGSLNLESGPGRVGSRTFWGNRETKEGAKVLPDTPKDPAGLPKQRACADEGRKEECVSYATVAAGELVWPQCLSVEVVGVGGQTSSKPEGADEVSDQIGDEADCPPDDLCSNVKVDPDAGGTGGDIPLQAKTETGDTGLMSTPKEEPRSGTAVISTATKQVSNDTTSSKEIPRSNESPNSKQEDHHSRVPNQGTVITVGIEVTEPETIEKKTMEKKTTENKSTPDQATTKPILSIDKDAINQNLPTPTSQPKRNPKTKALPVEFSRRFKGTRVDDISFCFDPTVVEPKPQGPSSIPALESSQGSGGSISTRLVSGPTHSTTTVVPAGGGLQLQSSGTSAPNCSRPIAPLSGSGHVSGAKTPVVVVNPMQLVARGPAEASQTIVGNDTDPEILKEVMVHTDAVAPMMIFSSKMDDIAGATRADSTRLGVNVPTRPLQLDEDPSTVEDADLTKRATLVEELPCGSRTETPGSSSLKQGDSQPKPHPDPASLHLSCGDAQIDAPPQQFVHPYVLYRPCVETCPQVVPGVSRQGVVGTPVLDAVLAPPLYQPQSRRDQPWGVRPQMHCAHPSLPMQVAVPAASLVLIQNYIHNGELVLLQLLLLLLLRFLLLL